ncbi:AlkA N-terminal domain-containing protein [Geomonas propionica]|uniref:DNA-3-methyladenine glycosylase II n=1 Tax=Geomonas propionica TaxID=2798582 RepID=A0ABS0YSU6_9BACT|nr:AlkA N-terminal domain-containing protein [Geomonas propionica]MBJ6800570.1 helix-turn-helix domain-containing protein [Geomonas propionica]
MAQHEERIWYAALKAKDARFDGHFFVGVSSTGIYCRPICRAKLPKPENCTFYTTAAAAEQAGFRPCLLCRPERAPGTAPVDATLALVHRAKVLLEENCGSGVSIEAIADQLGCTDRHMRRVFSAAYNVTPVQYLQTCRLLLAKNLLTDTDLSVIDVAMAAGFGSLRRFNDLFKTRYRMAPTALRRQSPTTKSRDNAIVLALGYRPPYQWRQMLDFLAQRAIPGVETVIDGAYLRTVHLVSAEKRHVFGWVRVGHRPESNVLTVTVDGALLPVLTQLLARIRHLFDLFCDPDAVYEVLAAMNTVGLNLCTPGTRLPGCFDPFEMAVRAVLGQQITVKAARTLAARLVLAQGTPVATGIEGLTHAFPSPQQIIALAGPIDGHLGPLGITGARARTILELAQAMVREEINFNFGAEPQTELKKLMAIPGIGPWTAQYIAMRAMGWPDAFPDTDFGVKKALAPRTAKEISALAETWRPWRSYATVNLWNSL